MAGYTIVSDSSSRYTAAMHIRYLLNVVRVLRGSLHELYAHVIREFLSLVVGHHLPRMYSIMWIDS